MTLNRFKAVGSVYGVQSLTQSVSEIKSAMWQTFVGFYYSVMISRFLCMSVFYVFNSCVCYVSISFTLLCYRCSVMNEWMDEWMDGWIDGWMFSYLFLKTVSRIARLRVRERLLRAATTNPYFWLMGDQPEHSPVARRIAARPAAITTWWWWRWWWC